MNYLYYADFESGSVVANSFIELQRKLEKKFPEKDFTGVCLPYMLENKNYYSTTIEPNGWFNEFGFGNGRHNECQIYKAHLVIGRTESRKTTLGDFSLPAPTQRTERLFPIFTKQHIYKKSWHYYVLCSESFVIRITDDSIEFLHNSKNNARSYFYKEYEEASYEEAFSSALKVLKKMRALLKEPISVIWRWNCIINIWHYAQAEKGYVRISGDGLCLHEGIFCIEDKERGLGGFKYSEGKLADAAFTLEYFVGTVARLLQNPNRRYKNWEAESRNS